MRAVACWVARARGRCARRMGRIAPRSQQSRERSAQLLRLPLLPPRVSAAASCVLGRAAALAASRCVAARSHTHAAGCSRAHRQPHASPRQPMPAHASAARPSHLRACARSCSLRLYVSTLDSLWRRERSCGRQSSVCCAAAACVARVAWQQAAAAAGAAWCVSCTHACAALAQQLCTVAPGPQHAWRARRRACRRAPC